MKCVSANQLLGLLIGSPVLLILAMAWGQDTPQPYIKNAMCIACHKGRNPGLVDRYQSTKHAQAVPNEGMAPVDIYRRSVGFKSADNSYYEKGVGCQSCHDPGAAHLKAKGDEEKKATMQRVDALEKPTQKLSVAAAATVTTQSTASPSPKASRSATTCSRWKASSSPRSPSPGLSSNSTSWNPASTGPTT